MLTLYYANGGCSIAPHIVLEEGGEKYEAKRVDFSKAEQRTEAYIKTVHHLGRVPALGGIDAGPPLTENTAILPYLGKRFGLWPTDPVAEARALSLIGFFAATVHPAHAHVSRPERYATDQSHVPAPQAQRKQMLFEYLPRIDRMRAGRQWLSDQYSVLDPYAFVFYVWGLRREVPVAELKNYVAHKDRMLARPAVQRVVEDEKLKV
jgi:glutathione S-transferase